MLDMQAPTMIARNFEGKVESRLAAKVITELQNRGGARNDTAAVSSALANP